MVKYKKIRIEFSIKLFFKYTHFNQIIKQMYINIYLKPINMFTKEKSGMVCRFYKYSLIIFFVTKLDSSYITTK